MTTSIGQRFWLPPGKLNPTPLSEQDHLLNEIKESGYFIPGARDLDIAHLRDLAQACREKKAKQDLVDTKAAEDGKKAVERMDPKQIQGALKQYLDWRRKRRGL